MSNQSSQPCFRMNSDYCDMQRIVEVTFHLLAVSQPFAYFPQKLFYVCSARYTFVRTLWSIDNDFTNAIIRHWCRLHQYNYPAHCHVLNSMWFSDQSYTTGPYASNEATEYPGSDRGRRCPRAHSPFPLCRATVSWESLPLENRKRLGPPQQTVWVTRRTNKPPRLFLTAKSCRFGHQRRQTAVVHAVGPRLSRRVGSTPPAGGRYHMRALQACGASVPPPSGGHGLMRLIDGSRRATWHASDSGAGAEAGPVALAI